MLYDSIKELERIKAFLNNDDKAGDNESQYSQVSKQQKMSKELIDGL